MTENAKARHLPVSTMTVAAVQKKSPLRNEKATMDFGKKYMKSEMISPMLNFTKGSCGFCLSSIIKAARQVRVEIAAVTTSSVSDWSIGITTS